MSTPSSKIDVATLLPPLLTGTLFGTALTLSSVALPTIITSQLSLTSSYMFTAFLTASAISAVIIYVSNRSYVACPPRSNTSYGWFGAYDANVVGGLCQGFGMAVTGCCPGTGIVQGVLGVPGVAWVGFGGLLGAMTFVNVDAWLKRGGGGKVGSKNVKRHTVMQRLKVSDETALLGYEMFLGATVVGITWLTRPNLHDRLLMNPVMGGCLIGGAQAASVLLSRKTLGVSSAYSDLASHVTSLVKGSGLASTTGFGNMVFAVGVGLGAKLVGSHGRGSMVGEQAGMRLSVPMALAGGFASIFGARMAGGCTSGHGISGMSTLSVSSFVTVFAMFGGGIVVRLLLNEVM